MTLGEIDALNAEIWQTCSNDVRQALQSSLTIRQKAEEIGYVRGLACALRNLGECHWILLDYAAALPNLLEALRLFRELEDASEEANVLNALGRIHFRLNDYPAALDWYIQSLRLRQQTGDPRGEAASLNNIGLVYFDMARYLDAHQHYSRSLKIHEEIGNLTGVAIVLNNLGLVYEVMEDRQGALDCHRRSLEIKRSLGNLTGMCASLNNLGDLYCKMGDYAQALDYNRQSLEISCRTEQSYYAALAWINMGEAHQALDDLEQAMTCYAQGIEALQGVSDSFTRADTLLSIAANFTRRGLLDQARDYLTQALSLGETLESQELISRAHHALSALCEAQGDPEHALEHFKAYHEARAALFTEEFNLRRRLLHIQAEVERVKNEAEIHRLKHVELAQAYCDLQQADTQKAELLGLLKQQTQELERLTHEDMLTGVSNRRHLYQQAALEYERARRFDHALTIVMADIDDFKRINDNYSHQVGDTVLRAVAQLLKDGCRSVDVVGRYGGEEFMILLTETDCASGLRLCERLRTRIEALAWEVSPDLKVTISFGVADNHEAAELEKIIALADARLYCAKLQGKNRVCGIG
jgi:diguanylate cyclase (GGDEF)-like protein